MLGYAKIFRDRVFAEAKAEVKAEYHQKILEIFEWNHRRIQAEEDGREFTEPIPIPEDNLESDESQ